MIKGSQAKSIMVWLLLSAICLPLAGCWDQRELQNRHMVLAAAIDVVDGDVKESETFVEAHGGRNFRLSVQLLDIEPQEGEQGEGKERTYVISGVGRLFFEIMRDMFGQLGRPISWEHIQAIVISQAAVDYGGIDQLLDWFSRDAEMRWRIRLYITPGEAKPIIEYQPPGGEPNGLFLTGISRNYIKNPHIGSVQTELGYASGRIDNKIPIPIPKIELSGDIIKVGGIGIVKNGQVVGYLDEYETLGAKFIMGSEKSAIITTACKDHPDRVFALELYQHDTTLEPHVSGDNIYYTLDITVYGSIGEMQTCPEPNDHNLIDAEFLEKMEQQFAEEVQKTVVHAYERHQTLKVDSLGMGKKLQNKYPKKWIEIKDRWNEEVFPHVPLIVSVNVSIRHTADRK
ncbi:Spore germination protein A3 [Sporomusa rhizae]|uniref:Ger(x)C family spore germination protein n=1 Tax=Sporomusa rhizae TaxID=357999 RepID=UPI00352B15C9